jgi:signal transduction histidine kinase
LNIVANELKYKADVVKEFQQLPDIECLPSQINQVIMNLIVNASQAMGPERGTITLRTGLEGETVSIEVADTGIGIEPDNLQKIFDPFYTTKPVGQGTGLGLSLSYGIVKKHQGDISVRSEVGVGSTFRVELPVRQSWPA